MYDDEAKAEGDELSDHAQAIIVIIIDNFVRQLSTWITASQHRGKEAGVKKKRNNC